MINHTSTDIQPIKKLKALWDKNVHPVQDGRKFVVIINIYGDRAIFSYFLFNNTRLEEKVNLKDTVGLLYAQIRWRESFGLE